MKKIINGAQIIGISSCLPKTSHPIDQYFCDGTLNEINRIKSITEINNVRYAQHNTTASDLCFAATENLLNQLSVKSNNIDAIIFVSQTRDFILPNTANILQKRLNLSNECIAVDLPGGCSGYISGLFFSKLLISSGAAKNALLLCGDTNSKILNKRDRPSRMIFGDAGTATLIAQSEKFSSYFNIKADGSGFDSIIIPGGGYRKPMNSESLNVTERGNGNFRCDLDIYMDGMSVVNFAITEIPQIIKQSLNDLNITADDIDLFALHQANGFILKQISKIAKIDPQKIPFLSGNVGNTGPASIPLLLSTGFFNQTKILKSVLMCGFGVGLNWGTCVCNLSDTKIYETIEI
jgi:3-oxoacyl-[acyl-carrier-protein] synthase-3